MIRQSIVQRLSKQELELHGERPLRASLERLTPEFVRCVRKLDALEHPFDSKNRVTQAGRFGSQTREKFRCRKKSRFAVRANEFIHARARAVRGPVHRAAYLRCFSKLMWSSDRDDCYIIST